jgi:hypothetical protein
MLPCSGIVEISNASGAIDYFQLLFRTPSACPPKSLRSMLLSGTLHRDLPRSSIIRIAALLAQTVLSFNKTGVVHKSIRPETIIVSECSGDLTLYLMGFEYYGPGEERFPEPRLNVPKMFYWHWLMRGEYDESDWTMRDDIHSLGICLLEIGLGRSLVIKTTVGTEIMEELVEEFHFENMNWHEHNAVYRRKSKLVELAETNLPQTMGQTYTDVVVTCITCRDHGNPFTSIFDYLGEVLCITFIEKVSHCYGI